MDQILVVVESPAKARTIKKYLGEGYKVKASVGHVRDLPTSELGIDIEAGFTPKYRTVKGKSKIVKELRHEMSKSSKIYLATDMDREGEAIAWHLREILQNSGPSIKRIIFNEITRSALREAIANPRDIDINKVNAQQARRVLDRLVGYLVSPVLWRIFYKGLSAGRVQSAGLRLICEREEKIRHFAPEEFWTIEGVMQNSGGEDFPIRLLKVDGKKHRISSKEAADEILASIKEGVPEVAEVRDKEKRRNPYPPFITSTLQREAASRLGFSAKKTMVVAQQLYEGVELGDEGSVALISYMRTDSTRVSDEAYARGVSCIRRIFGEDVAYRGKRGFKKAKQSQDAHEAIRPTDCTRKPDEVAKYLSRDQAVIYELIWRRFLASLCAAAVYKVREVDIKAGKRFLLRASGRRLSKAGFLTIMPDRKSEEESWLPALSKGEKLSSVSMKASQHFTEPPARYTEASLIKELEEKGIGRPSTYASILSIIQARDYARKSKGSFHPTDLGENVWKILEKLFRDIFEIDFTARMETELDKIEKEEEDWRDVVRFFYEPLTSDLENVDARKGELKLLVQEETDQLCENCGRRLVKKWSKNGPFLACPGFPDCRYSRSIDEEEPIEKKCPKCCGRLGYRKGRFGRFIACLRYPDCKYTEPVTLGIPCPEDGCGGEITEKRTKRGKIFYGCTKYPDCKYASWEKPTSQRCPRCSETYLVQKETKKNGRFLKCPSCKFEVTT